MKVINKKIALQARVNIIKKFNESVDVTIGIVAYNRLDITKLCIQSVLDNTKNIKYKLVLVYNENEQGEGILEYFNSIDYDNKVVIHIKENVGAPFAYQYINKHIEGKYFVHLPNDVIVTPNWLLNLIKCAESDNRIGMVNPVSSNVSNLQCVTFSFDSYDEMQKKAADYNVSNPLKWQERIRLITLGTLFTRECLSAIGPVFDIGFMHDFGDDDVSFRVRRAGYKAVLGCDTWVHHAHDVFHMENKNPEEYQKSLKEGRENFNQKYFGIDPWDDVNNFVFPYIEKNIIPPADKNNVKVLGIDVKCGTPILDIKNSLRASNVLEPHLSAFTFDAKYYIDLKTICDDVVCDRHEYLINSFKETKFDYIIIGDSINSYKEPKQIIEDAYCLLNNGGQLFVSLKNTYNAITLLKMLGHNVNINENVQQIEFSSFYNELKNSKMKIELINCQLYELSDEIINYCLNLIQYAKSEDSDEKDLLNQLKVDKYWFKITK